MHVSQLAQLLATTEDHPRNRSRVLFFDVAGDVAGYVDAVGDVVTVLDQLDTEGSAALGVQVRIGAADHLADRPAAVVADRDGAFAVHVGEGHGEGEAWIDRVPHAGDPASVQLAWRFVVHALAALGRADAIPEPPDDPHPATYLTTAWLTARVDAAKLDPAELDDLELPDEAELVDALELPADVRGWDAVLALVERDLRHHGAVARLGRNGVAWEAHVLVGDPAPVLASVAESGRVEVADRLFDALLERGWARRA